MDGTNKKSTAEKIKIFRDLFTGLTHVYGTYNPSTGRAGQVKARVTDKVLHAHLTGKKPYGVYLLMKDQTRALAIDFDTNDPLAPTEFVNRSSHYGMSTYIERSKLKGYHAWIFFENPGVTAQKARMVTFNILEEIEKPETEVFPKQDSLDTDVQYGNFINAPLFGALVPNGKTVFLDPATFEPYPDQWAFLETVVRHSESTLDAIIEINAIPPHPRSNPINENTNKGQKSPFSLPPCIQKMCMDGVSEYQRVSCFRLAVQFKRLGLPYDMAVAALKTWALKNRPTNGKGVIRENEIMSQAAYAYQRDYRGYGCESAAIKAFCDPSCPVKAKHG